MPLNIEPVSLGSGLYCSHWGLTDLYAECEEKLRDLLQSGEEFITDWCGSKKEIISARYSRLNGVITVEVCQSIDGLWESEDLIYDAVWEKLHTEELELPEEIIDSIRDASIDEGIDDNITLSEELPSDASYDDVMAAVGRLENSTDEALSAWYKELCNIVAAHVEYMKGGETSDS